MKLIAFSKILKFRFHTGDGLSTERARLAQGGYRGHGFGTERARLAQGGLLGPFYKRNRFKRNFCKSQNFAQKRAGG